MRGAIVFRVVFLAFLAATLAYPDMPLGKQLYGSLGVPEIDYLVIGMPVTTLVIACSTE